MLPPGRIEGTSFISRVLSKPRPAGIGHHPYFLRGLDGAGNIEGHLAFLKNAVESVVNSGWVGVAAQSAAGLHATLDKAGRDVTESTTFFSQSTDQAAKNYAQREDEVRSAFSGG